MDRIPSVATFSSRVGIVAISIPLFLILSYFENVPAREDLDRQRQGNVAPQASLLFIFNKYYIQ